MGGIRAYVINMDAARERWRLMEEQLQRLDMDYERFPGVNGRALDASHPDFSDTSYKLLHGRRFNAGEIGCYLSHVGALKAFLATDRDHALILEDDVAIDPATPHLIAEAVAAGGWDVLRLSTVNRGRKFPYRKLSNGHALAVALTREKGAGAYVVNRKAAQWMASLLPIRMAWDYAFDLEYLAGLRASFVTPIPCDQNTGMPTQIQINLKAFKMPRWRYFTVFPFRAFLETSRFTHRSLRLLRLKLFG